MRSRPLAFGVLRPMSGGMTKATFLTLLLCIACGGSPASTEAPAQTTGAETASATSATSAADPVQTGSVAAALAGAHRSDEHRGRDAHRHPAETLAFFGVTPEMRVVEVWPGGGWYSEILAPLVRDRGTLIAAGYDPEDTGRRGGYERAYREKLAERPEVYDQIEHVVFTGDALMTDVPDASVDAVLVFRAVHNMVRDGNVPAYFNAMARVLKPGGVLGIVAHRMPEGLDVPNDGSAGYLTEASVIAFAEAAGFTLAERSEINANPQDTHVHPDGVWSMPPGLRGGDESLRNLGESDRMTLRFVNAEAPVE